MSNAVSFLKKFSRQVLGLVDDGWRNYSNNSVIVRLEDDNLTKSKIPKILHQSWKDSTPPTNYAENRKTWLEMHPHWLHYLWTDEDNRELLRLNYPWFLPYYDRFPLGVMRADTMRYFYMHRYGGIYADLDTEPLRPLDFLMDNATTPVTVAYLGKYYDHLEHNVPAIITLSEPGHLLWMIVIRWVMKTATRLGNKKTRPDYVTGPLALAIGIEAYYQSGLENMQIFNTSDWAEGSLTQGSTQVGDIKVLEPGLLYPFHWDQGDSEIGRICSGGSPQQNKTECKKQFPNAYAITYHGYSWGKDWDKYRG